MEIRVEYTESSLFGGWGSTELYDQRAGFEAFGALLQRNLEEQYPDAEIAVCESSINDRVTVDGRADHEEVPFVEQAVSDTYQSYEWVRYTREGLKQCLQVSGAFVQFDGGLLVIADKVNFYGLDAYRVSWLMGEDKPQTGKTYTDIDRALDEIEAVAPVNQWQYK